MNIFPMYVYVDIFLQFYENHTYITPAGLGCIIGNGMKLQSLQYRYLHVHRKLSRLKSIVAFWVQITEFYNANKFSLFFWFSLPQRIYTCIYMCKRHWRVNPHVTDLVIFCNVWIYYELGMPTFQFWVI